MRISPNSITNTINSTWSRSLVHHCHPSLSLSRHRVGITHADNSTLQVWSPATCRTSHLSGQGPGPAAGMSRVIFRTSPTATWLLPAPQDAKHDRGRSPGSHHSSAAVVRPARNPLTSAWQLYQDTATASHRWLYRTAGVRPNISSCHAWMSHHSLDETGTIIYIRRPQIKAAINICLSCGATDQARSLNISLRRPHLKAAINICLLPQRRRPSVTQHLAKLREHQSAVDHHQP